MPLLATPRSTEAPAHLATDVARMQGESGAFLDLALLYGLRPDLYHAIGQGYDAFFRSDSAILTAEERECVGLLVALIDCTPYAIKIHRARIAELEINAEVLNAIETRDLNSTALSHRQRAFLNFARKMVAFPHTIVDKDIIYLTQNGFDEAGILELGALLSYLKMMGTMVNAFKVEAT